MTREKKLEAIYKEMANKKLKLWCKCKNHNWENVIFIRQNKTWSYLSIRENEEFTVSLWYTPEIIWHPVMIGTIFEWYSKKRGYINSQFVMNLIEIWTWYDKPIELQSDYCVDFVHSLIKKI